MRIDANRIRPLAGMLVSLVLVAACATATTTPAPAASSDTPAATSGSVAPSATPSPTPTPTPTPAPTATPAPTPTPTPDVTAGLQISSPYALVDSATSSSVRFSFSFEANGVQVDATMQAKEIQRRGVSVGYMFVMAMNGITWTRAAFDKVVEGGANSVNGKIGYTRIDGHRVGLIRSASGSVAMCRLGDRIVETIASDVSMKSAKTLITAIIKAN